MRHTGTPRNGKQAENARHFLIFDIARRINGIYNKYIERKRHSHERERREAMTETEARKRYKAEWAKKNRDKIRATYQRFYERKAAEYEAADAARRMTPEEKIGILETEIAMLDEKIAHPESAISEWERERRALITEQERLKREAAV
jgi:hypothetical protein